MKINLFRISPEGEHYKITEADKEVATELADLLGENSKFTCEFDLQTIGEAIEITGKFEGKSPQECSFCSESYGFPISVDFKEYLVPSNPPNKTTSKDSESVSEQDAGLGIEHENFFPAKFLRDRIGFAIPFQIPCKTEQENCENYAYIEKALNRHKSPELEDSNPFNALKNLEIDKKR